MPNLTLANLVRDRREALGLTRPMLSDRSGVSVSTIARLELQGHVPSVRALAAIAGALDVPAESLLTSASAA